MAGLNGTAGSAGTAAYASTMGGTPLNGGCSQGSGPQVAPCHNGTTGQNGGNSGNVGSPWFGAPTTAVGIIRDTYVSDGSGNPPGGPFGEWVPGVVAADTLHDPTGERLRG